MKETISNFIRSMLLTYFPIVWLCLLSFAFENSGMYTELRAIPVIERMKKSFPSSNVNYTSIRLLPVANSSEDSSTKAHKEFTSFLVSDYFVIISVLIQITITVLQGLLLGYLGSLSTVKHCLMLYLYRELVRITLILSWIWTLTVIICLVNGNGITVDTFTAKFTSYCFYGLNLHGLLCLDLIGIIKLYTTKEKVVDPSMPWDDDDQGFFKKLRLGCLLFTSFLLTTMYLTDAHPKLYYILTGDNRSLLELPKATSISSGILVLLIAIYALTRIATVFYKTNEDDYSGNRFHAKLNSVFSLVVCIGSLIIFVGVFMNLLNDGSIWIVHLLMSIVMGVLPPVYIIVCTSQFKTYVQKIIARSTYECISFLLRKYAQLFSYPNVLKSSSRIQPLE